MLDFILSFAGGVLIGLSASLYLWGTGRVAGISGIIDQAISLEGLIPKLSPSVWFLFGLVTAGVGGQFFGVIAPQPPMPLGPWGVVGAGLLVGLGTRLGGGCTSGHGVCGMSRFQTRSIIATIAFMSTGVLTIALLRLSGLLQ